MFLNALLLMACTPPSDDASARGTMVAHARALWSVNPWDDTLVRTRPGAGSSEEWALEGEPTRLALVGDELWVTLRATREVVVVDPRADGAELARIRVGAEPYGVVATPDGSTVYVAVSQQHEVVEIDVASREVLRRFPTPDDPRWLAVHPSGRALFVAHATSAELTRIDLETGVQTQLEAPETRASGSGNRPQAGRASGDPALSPKGDVLVVPVLYVDNQTPAPQPEVDGEEIVPPRVGYYENQPGPTVGRFNPAVVTIPLDSEDGTPAGGETRALMVTGPDGATWHRGVVSAVTVDDDGLVWASLETADAVAVLSLEPTPFPSYDGRAAPVRCGFDDADQVVVTVGDGPTSVVAVDDQLWVHHRGGREVGMLPVEGVRDLLRTASERRHPQPLFPERTLAAGTIRLDPMVERGRRLFTSATDGRITAPGSGVSCSTCHVDGRDDGLTWAFDDQPRQTPSLAGPVLETAPVTWTDDIVDVGFEAQITSIGRMGGLGLLDEEVEDLVAFIASIRPVDLPDHGRKDPEVLRGAELFADPAVGCATCHSGAYYTDNAFHELYGHRVNTPSLIGVGATAPYLHDGSHETLRGLLETLRGGAMGSTAGLSDADLDALEAFLKTL